MGIPKGTKMNLTPEQRQAKAEIMRERNKDPAYRAKMFSPEAIRKKQEKDARKRRFNELARYMMEAPIADEDELLEELKAHGFTQADYQSAVFWSQLKKAIYGMDTEAAKFVRDTAGFKPTDALQIGNLDDQPFETLDLSKLSNEELRSLIAKKSFEEDE